MWNSLDEDFQKWLTENYPVYSDLGSWEKLDRHTRRVLTDHFAELKRVNQRQRATRQEEGLRAVWQDTEGWGRIRTGTVVHGTIAANTDETIVTVGNRNAEQIVWTTGVGGAGGAGGFENLQREVIQAIDFNIPDELFLAE